METLKKLCKMVFLHHFIDYAHSPDEEPDYKVDKEDSPVGKLHLFGIGCNFIFSVSWCIILEEHDSSRGEV